MLGLNNFFVSLEKTIVDQPEKTIFSEKKIMEFSENYIQMELKKISPNKRGWFFQKIVCDFFRFKRFRVIECKKTRDLGIDAVIKKKFDILGDLQLGLQIKYKKIGAADIDSFIQALDFAEIRLGVIACKESSRLDKYTLSSKMKALLLGLPGKKIKIKERIQLKPVFVITLNEIIKLISSDARLMVRSIYKR
ncbi:restriction endonuclease [Candidatus Micrarchaeota archaeon]|nr:restriction endonuclease [Candidatus Micrarchaeota archaeon]